MQCAYCSMQYEVCSICAVCTVLGIVQCAVCTVKFSEGSVQSQCAVCTEKFAECSMQLQCAVQYKGRLAGPERWPAEVWSG